MEFYTSSLSTHWIWIWNKHVLLLCGHITKDTTAFTLNTLILFFSSPKWLWRTHLLVIQLIWKHMFSTGTSLVNNLAHSRIGLAKVPPVQTFETVVRRRGIFEMIWKPVGVPLPRHQSSFFFFNVTFLFLGVSHMICCSTRRLPICESSQKKIQ